MTNIHTNDAKRAVQEARAQLASIEDLVACLHHADECTDTACGADCTHDWNEAREAILDDPLTVEVRTDWHRVGAVEAAKPTHYKILLCWGGPAVQIVGTLDAHNQPESAALEHQDWFTEWTTYPLSATA